MKFFVGIHIPAHAGRFERCMVSVGRIRNRRSSFPVNEWMMDSQAFTEISTHGRYRHEVAEYAEQINRWKYNGRLLAAVAQDYMCEPFILAKTGLTIADHQRLTIERYDALNPLCPDVYILPVLQGWTARDYVSHVQQYGKRLAPGAWVGVGSICKRNSRPREIEEILIAIKSVRPDLELHLFGVKLTALGSGIVQELGATCDSMAWSWNARRNGRSANDPAEAERYVLRVKRQPVQGMLIMPSAGVAA
jgi:hypothetical protein